MMVTDYREQFRAAIEAAGLTPPESMHTDSCLHRFPSNGQHGDDAGYYVLHGDGVPTGIFGDWRTGVKETWRADIGRPLSFVEAEAQRARIAEAKQKREAEQARERAEAAAKAKILWKRAQPARADHPYLTRKGVSPVATLREIPAETAAAILGYVPKARGEMLTGRLLVAPIKVGAEWSSAEMIDVADRKSAIAGGAKAAGYWATGAPPEGDGTGLTIAIVEGVATALTMAQATEGVALAALSSGNLGPVARAVRARYPEAPLIVGADLGNGQDKAEQAARAVGALLVVPDFGEDRPEGATDLNDLAQHAGAEAVKSAVMNARVPDTPSSKLRRRTHQRPNLACAYSRWTSW